MLKAGFYIDSMGVKMTPLYSLHISDHIFFFLSHTPQYSLYDDLAPGILKLM